MLSKLYRTVYDGAATAIGWSAAVGAYAGYAAMLPVYVPVCVGMWTGFYLTDMQRNTDHMLSQRLGDTN